MVFNQGVDVQLLCCNKQIKVNISDFWRWWWWWRWWWQCMTEVSTVAVLGVWAFNGFVPSPLLVRNDFDLRVFPFIPTKGILIKFHLKPCHSYKTMMDILLVAIMDSFLFVIENIFQINLNQDLFPITNQKSKICPCWKILSSRYQFEGTNKGRGRILFQFKYSRFLQSLQKQSLVLSEEVEIVA